MSVIILPVFYYDIKVNQEHVTVFIVYLNIFKCSLIIIKNFDTLVPNSRNIKKRNVLWDVGILNQMWDQN